MKKNKIQYFNYDDSNFKHLFKKHMSKRNNNNEDIYEIVHKILKEVKDNGDNSLLRMVREFDNHKITHIKETKIDHNSLRDAYHKLPILHKQALNFASKRIRNFHERQKPISFDFKDELGVKLGLKYNRFEY